jgi:hypothetical protein
MMHQDFIGAILLIKLVLRVELQSRKAKNNSRENAGEKSLFQVRSL